MFPSQFLVFMFAFYSISSTVSLAQSIGGTVMGVVVDAGTQKPVTNATITIAGRTTRTDAQGRYRLDNIPPTPKIDFAAKGRWGNFPRQIQLHNTSEQETNSSGILTCSAQGYDTYQNKRVQIVTLERTYINILLSQELPQGGFRIVLTWGEKPQDLNAAIVIEKPMQGIVSIINSFFNPVLYPSLVDISRFPFAIHSENVRNGFGPETITLYRTVEGKYSYIVENADFILSNQNSLAGSKAVVQVFTKQGLIHTIEAPEKGGDKYWTVFTIDGATGAITIVNTLTNQKPL